MRTATGVAMSTYIVVGVRTQSTGMSSPSGRTVLGQADRVGVRSVVMDIEKRIDMLKADGFDDAIIGVATDFTEPRLVYSVSICLDILKESMEYEDAIEYFEFNVSGAYVGEQTPIWCWDIFD